MAENSISHVQFGDEIKAAKISGAEYHPSRGGRQMSEKPMDFDEEAGQTVSAEADFRIKKKQVWNNCDLLTLDFSLVDTLIRRTAVGCWYGLHINPLELYTGMSATPTSKALSKTDTA